jgi:hypothetical protein
MFSVQIVGIDIKGPCILQKKYVFTLTMQHLPSQMKRSCPWGLKPTPSYEVHHSDKHIEFLPGELSTFQMWDESLADSSLLNKAPSKGTKREDPISSQKYKSQSGSP